MVNWRACEARNSARLRDHNEWIEAASNRFEETNVNTASAVGTVTVTHCDASGTWLVALQGEHDLATVPLLEKQTSPVWPACNVAVIDLSETLFIDSSVIKWLLRSERALEASGAFTLSIVEGAPGSVAARLFALLRMPDVLACYATRQAALTQAE
jgi:anti-anti-sigma regulatory factor